LPYPPLTGLGALCSSSLAGMLGGPYSLVIAGGALCSLAGMLGELHSSLAGMLGGL
jgi:hypothetical protein